MIVMSGCTSRNCLRRSAGSGRASPVAARASGPVHGAPEPMTVASYASARSVTCANVSVGTWAPGAQGCCQRLPELLPGRFACGSHDEFPGAAAVERGALQQGEHLRVDADFC